MRTRPDWRQLTGKSVEVIALGVAFRGVVVEMGERAILLRTPGGYREIPWDRITAVRALPERKGGTGSRFE